LISARAARVLADWHADDQRGYTKPCFGNGKVERETGGKAPGTKHCVELIYRLGN
jgi:hypothetical protein